MSSNNIDKPKIKLPFESKKFDIGEWVFAHRAGLCVTLITYLVIAIAFLTAKITFETTHTTNAIAIDLQQLVELERQRDELKKSVEELQKNQTPDWESVQNKRSNENALDQSVKDDRNTDVDKLIRDAEEFQRQMEQNRATYESGVAEAKAIKERPTSTQQQDSDSEHQDSKVNGSVTVSYSLDNPVRHAQKLTVPAYLCEGGGEVIIEILVAQSGEVTDAKVISGGDDCMQQSALSSAKTSKFDRNTAAPNRQRGTISYIFIPQ